VASLLVATQYEGNHDSNNKLWNIVSTERCIHHLQVLLECRINWEMYTPYADATGMLYQLRDVYTICRCCWNIVSAERCMHHMQVLLECRINWEMYTPYTGAAGISYQLRDVYTIGRCSWNVVSTKRCTHHIQVLLECCINWKMYTPYAGAAGMLLHINVKLTTNFNLCLVAFTIPLTVLTH
jgi:hypothetical protein